MIPDRRAVSRLLHDAQVAYRLVTEQTDHSDLASGFVLRSAPGYPAFPVRLASELFLRGLSHLPAGPVGLWDPCCGSGYLATVLGLRHRERLRSIVVTDVAPDAVELARRNLDLLAPGGLARRAAELRARHVELGKPVHSAAAAAADRLGAGLAGEAVPWTAGVADVLDATSLAGLVPSPAPDIVVTDLPYGRQVHWQGADGVDPLPAMVDALCAVLPDHAVVAVTVAGRKVPLAPALERFRVGTRAAFIGRVAQLRD